MEQIYRGDHLALGIVAVVGYLLHGGVCSVMMETIKNILEGLRITNETVKDLMCRIAELEKRISKLER